MRLINSLLSIVKPMLLFLMLFIFLAGFYTWRKNLPVRRWRKRLFIDKHERFFHQIYQDVNGFSLSRQAREDLDAMEYIYGEIKFESFVALLSMAHPNTSTIFYDLGCGVGKAVLACSMVFSVKKSCGIEIFPNLYECALAQKKRLQTLPTYQNAANQIEFKLGNILQYNFEDADLIFINATAFFGDHWTTISQQVENIKSKAKVITTSKPLRSNLFQIIATTQVEMSWGIVEAYIQEKF